MQAIPKVKNTYHTANTMLHTPTEHVHKYSLTYKHGTAHRSSARPVLLV